MVAQGLDHAEVNAVQVIAGVTSQANAALIGNHDQPVSGSLVGGHDIGNSVQEVPVLGPAGVITRVVVDDAVSVQKQGRWQTLVFVFHAGQAK
jgi:hypothetical protein